MHYVNFVIILLKEEFIWHFIFGILLVKIKNMEKFYHFQVKIYNNIYTIYIFIRY